MPTSRASSASSNSIPPGPSEPRSIPSARKATRKRYAGASRAERDQHARREHRADEEENDAFVHPDILAARGR